MKKAVIEFILIYTLKWKWYHVTMDVIVRLSLSPRKRDGIWNLHETLGTRLNFTTIFYPQLDDQCERVIQVLKDMLHSYFTNFEDNWKKYFPFMEFNESVGSSGKGVGVVEVLHSNPYEKFKGLVVVNRHSSCAKSSLLFEGVGGLGSDFAMKTNQVCTRNAGNKVSKKS
ncbi:DNA/RNA polymerase superfamily protein [Gossypium australe]|uniref:DNA/RNA polymerase superfamily protein n=1 Tax=Gossypium australe TaxID=47621 RepID=A0A5B6U6R4_9ROSI|nr:DNA/RNA polymerase superfamily protein [Gossypium australe]